MTKLALALAATLAAVGNPIPTPPYAMGHGRVRPGTLRGVHFQPDGGDPAVATLSQADLTEAVTIFQTKADEFHAEREKFGEASQETKNALAVLTKRVEEFEKRAHRPNLVGAHMPGSVTFMPDLDQPEVKSAFDKLIRRGEAIMRQTGPDELKLLQVSDDTQGGYLTTTEFASEIIKQVIEVSPVRKLARVVTIGAKSLTIPVRTSTPTAYWSGESGATTATNSGYGELEIPAHILTAESRITNDMLEDAAFNVQSEIQMDAAQQFAVAEGLAFVSGNGVKRPQGFLSNADVTSTQVVKSGSATLLAADPLITMCYSLKQDYIPGATWLMNRLTMAQVRILKDGAGKYIWQPGLEQNRPPTLLDLPYDMATDLAAPDSSGAFATNAYPIALADWKRFYTIVDRVAMYVVRDDITLASNNQVKFVMRKRTGGQVRLAEAGLLMKIST